MPEDKTSKKELDRFSLGEIATQTELVIIDNETKETYTALSILAKISNDINKIKKQLTG